MPLEGRAEEVVVAVRAAESVSPARFSQLLTALRCHAFTLAVVDADSTVSYYKVRHTRGELLCSPSPDPRHLGLF